MQLMLRIGSTADKAAYRFDVEHAVRSYYSLAPYHKEYRIEPLIPVPTPAPSEKEELMQKP